MNRLKWFETALQERHPGVTIEDLSRSLRISPEVFRDHITQGAEFDSMAGSVLQGLLGCSLNEFVEAGKTLSNGGPAPSETASAADADLSALLGKAKRIMEAGGDRADVLKKFISIL